MRLIKVAWINAYFNAGQIDEAARLLDEGLVVPDNGTLEFAVATGNVDIVVADTGIIEERDWHRCLEINLVRLHYGLLITSSVYTSY